MTCPRLLLACALLLCACSAPYRPNTALAWEATTPSLPPVLDVRNDHGSPMTLFLVLPGHRYFLGDVAPGARATFRLPAELLDRGPVQVLAQARGRALELLTRPIDFDRGHNFEFGIRRNLYSSRVRVR